MPRKNCVSAADPGLPAACLDDLQDCLTLALDASERPKGYTRSEREFRSYLRAAMRLAIKLRNAQVAA